MYKKIFTRFSLPKRKCLKHDFNQRPLFQTRGDEGDKVLVHYPRSKLGSSRRRVQSRRASVHHTGILRVRWLTALLKAANHRINRSSSDNQVRPLRLYFVHIRNDAFRFNPFPRRIYYYLTRGFRLFERYQQQMYNELKTW